MWQITGANPQRGTVYRDVNRTDAALHAGAYATPMIQRPPMPLTHPVTSHSAATSVYWIRTVAKHTHVTDGATAAPIPPDPQRIFTVNRHNLARKGVGSVGRLAGAASSTRLVTRQTARVEGTRQGRRGRARRAERGRRREGNLDGQPPCGRVARACVDSTVCEKCQDCMRVQGRQEGTRWRMTSCNLGPPKTGSAPC